MPRIVRITSNSTENGQSTVNIKKVKNKRNLQYTKAHTSNNDRALLSVQRYKRGRRLITIIKKEES
jgi:hypothetical protein